MCLHYDKQFAPTRITTINPFADVVPHQRSAETDSEASFGPKRDPCAGLELEAHLLFDYKQQRAAERQAGVTGAQDGPQRVSSGAIKITY